MDKRLYILSIVLAALAIIAGSTGMAGGLCYFLIDSLKAKEITFPIIKTFLIREVVSGAMIWLSVIFGVWMTYLYEGGR